MYNTFDVFVVIGIFRDTHVNHNVNRIRDIQMEISGAFVGVKGRSVSVVHFGPQVGPHETVWQTTGQVQSSVPMRVLRQRQNLHQIGEPRRQQFRKIFAGGPILQLQQHRIPSLVLQPFREMFESFPKLAHRLIRYQIPGHAIDQIVLLVPKIPGERVGMPEAHVQQLGNVRHDHRLPAFPLILKYPVIVWIVRIV